MSDQADNMEVKAEVSVDDDGTITGIAWPAGTTDIKGDQIAPGAFNLPRALPIVFEHDQSQVVGVWESYAETDKGLEVKGRLFVEGIGPSRQARQLLKRGAVKGLSIGFNNGVHDPLPGGGRRFSGLNITEISLCRSPVNRGARVTSVKSIQQETQMDPAEIIEEENAHAAVELKATNDNVVKLTGTLDKLTGRLDKMEAKLNRPAGAANDNAAKTDDTERKAFGTYLRLGSNAPAEELKALTVSSDPGGGYLAPAEANAEFIRNLTLFSPIRAIASVRSTTAPAVKYPKRNSITNAQWEGETDDQPESTMTFGQAEIAIRQVTTYVDISNQLLADSGGQAEAEVNLALGEDFGAKEGSAFVNGDGVKMPEGFMTNAAIASTPNGAGTIVPSALALIDLMYAMPAAYRATGTWVMNGVTLGFLRKLVDDTGRFLWQPGLTLGQPETILGRPVVEAPDMPDLVANACPIIFGNFQTAYRIVDRLSLSLLVNPYSLATKGITRIHATRRLGGGVIQPAALRKLVLSA